MLIRGNICAFSASVSNACAIPWSVHCLLYLRTSNKSKLKAHVCIQLTNQRLTASTESGERKHEQKRVGKQITAGLFVSYRSQYEEYGIILVFKIHYKKEFQYLLKESNT
jgi:hypothetical protein